MGPQVRDDRLYGFEGLSREETIAKILDLTDGGADFTFDATGDTEVMRTALDWYMQGKIAIEPMITHVLKLDEINKGST